MTGEAVAQHMRVQVLAQLTHAGLAHAQLHRAWTNTPTLLADKYRAVARVRQHTQWQPLLHRFTCHAPKRQLAGLVALADNPYQSGGQVEAVEVEAHQLRQTQA